MYMFYDVNLISTIVMLRKKLLFFFLSPVVFQLRRLSCLIVAVFKRVDDNSNLCFDELDVEMFVFL